MRSGDLTHMRPPRSVTGEPTTIQIAEVVAVNADDGTLDARPITSRATKAHLLYPQFYSPRVGERVLIANRDGDPRQPICLGFLAPADGSQAGPQIRGTVDAGTLPKASAAALGVTELSAAPADPATPIAVAVTDPAFTGAEQTARKGAANGYAPLDGNSLVPAGNLPQLPESQITNLTGDLAAKQAASQKDQANGYAGLDSGGKVPLAEIPAGATPGGAAGGDLAGTYPSPTIAQAVWPRVNAYGPYASRPAAAASNNGYTYLSADLIFAAGGGGLTFPASGGLTFGAHDGETYESDGSGWSQSSVGTADTRFNGQVGTRANLPGANTVAPGALYTATDNGITYQSDGVSTWKAIAWEALRVVALPTNPAPEDGQLIDYVADATNGVLWPFRYNAGSASAFKWEAVGEPKSLFNEVTANQNAGAGNVGAYADLGTVGPDITVPLAGDYDYRLGCELGNSGTDGTCRMSAAFGAAAAADADAATAFAGTAAPASSPAREGRKTGLAASALIRAKYKVSAGTHAFQKRTLRVWPVRVG